MRSIIALTVAVSSCCLAAAAAATPPSTEIRTGSGAFAIDCGAFSLLETFTVEERDTLFYAADGTPVRATLHFDYAGVITHSASGATWREPGHFTIGIDFAGTPLDPNDDMIAIAGELFQIVAPGLGTVVQDTGRLLALPAAIDELDASPTVVRRSRASVLENAKRSPSAAAPTRLSEPLVPLAEYNPTRPRPNLVDG